MAEHSILFISAGGAAAAEVENTLRGSSANLAVKRVDALFDGLHALQENPFDLILADLSLSDARGLATVTQLQQHAPRTPVLVLCGAADRDLGVQAVRKGAHDFFSYDDWDGASLMLSIDRIVKNSEAANEERKAAERRNSARFPCRLAVSYQTLESPIIAGQGTSETLNISSKGLLFTSQEKFQAGQLVQVSLDWPARLENQIPLKLVAEGRVVRNMEGQTAMTIDKYEFRTRRSPAPANGKAAPTRR